ncbi:ATPase P [Desulfobacter hydrogenophilus]|uniref:ATPase P n=1 Tax=Desulfobacter hydrogenophilus TaxID=2291 RepID=A0A328FED6_9BACT|nr:HAD family hydrolase [Desulfobacter hydrogenophilus]NDY71894.1 ATPase P [Desulfobacter hydrogenophilus]QBH11971.1 ATPase P [Desulfobacter hydrogenophilus]RAM02669.1 ATPase P [Desulfobacter hydrogenophilus]
MIRVDIPGTGPVNIQNVMFDYNGTIAADGCLIDGVGAAMNRLTHRLDFHVVTADTFGSVQAQLEGVNAEIVLISNQDQDQKKLDVLNHIGADTTMAVGNGVNDALMLKHAVLGVAVLGEEGMSLPALMSSDVMIRHVLDVFAFFENPKRLIATLRN